MSRNGFTLMEILVATLIITFLGWGMLRMQANTTHTMQMMKDQIHLLQTGSVALLRATKKEHDTQESLYAWAKRYYKLDYDPLIALLKKEEHRFTQQEVGFVLMGEAIKQGGVLYRKNIHDNTIGISLFSLDEVK